MDTTKLRQIAGGTVIKQADRSSTMSFILQDAIGREVDLDGQTAQVALYTLKGKYWETTSQVRGSIVSFSLPGNLSEDDYILDISVAGYVFPSDRDFIIRVVKGFRDLPTTERAERSKQTFEEIRSNVEKESEKRLKGQLEKIDEKSESTIQAIEKDGQEYISLIGTNQKSAVAEIEAKKKEALNIIEQKRQEFKGDQGEKGDKGLVFSSTPPADKEVLWVKNDNFRNLYKNIPISYSSIIYYGDLNVVIENDLSSTHNIMLYDENLAMTMNPSSEGDDKMQEVIGLINCIEIQNEKFIVLSKNHDINGYIYLKVSEKDFSRVADLLGRRNSMEGKTWHTYANYSGETVNEFKLLNKFGEETYSTVYVFNFNTKKWDKVAMDGQKGEPGKDGTVSIESMTQSQKESFAEEFGLNLNDKVDKEVGKGLSDNNFTNYYKNQLDTLDKSLDLKADKKDVKSQLQEVKDLIFDSTVKYHEDTIYTLDTVLESGEIKVKPKEIGKLLANDFLKVQVDAEIYKFRLKSTNKGVILFHSMTDESLRYAIHVCPNIKDYEINFGKKVTGEIIFTTVSMPEDKISIIREEGL